MVTVATHKQEDPLKVLEGKCTVSRQGWWTYQWCHRKEIRQYHSEEDGKRSQDWSLGSFEESSEKKVAKKTFNSQYKPEIYSKNGQKCDETGNTRWTEVYFDCCANDESNIAKQAEEENEDTYIR